MVFCRTPLRLVSWEIYWRNAQLAMHKCIFLQTQAYDGLDATGEEINNAKRKDWIDIGERPDHVFIQVFQKTSSTSDFGIPRSVSSVCDDCKHFAQSDPRHRGSILTQNLHSLHSTLWTLAISKMCTGALGYNILILH